MTAAPSTWAPLRIQTFRTLWIAALVSNVGEWCRPWAPSGCWSMIPTRPSSYP
jgi:hypothetical protein